MRLVAFFGVIATFVAIMGASAAMLTVDGGVLQTFVLDGPDESQIQVQSALALEPMSVPEACGELDQWSSKAVLLPGDGPFQAGPGKNLIFGSPADDVILAGPEQDCIVGGGGNDIIYGRSGADFLDGGDGFDSCDGGGDPQAVKLCEQPAGPFALTGEGHHSVPTIDLTWTGDANARSYNVYRSAVSAGSYVLIGTSFTPSYSDVGVQEGLPYHYVVRSVYADGSESDPSNEALVYGPDPVTPPANVPPLGEISSAMLAPTATETPPPTPALTPTDTPTPEPTETATPAPTATPSPTMTPSPTLTPSPTATETPTPTATPVPIPQACLDAGLAVFDQIVFGTEEDDEIVAGEGSHLVFGYGGNDTIRGSSAADCILAGPGDDTVHALESTDVVLGNEGGDYLYGGPGPDRIYGDEIVEQGTDVDTCDGGAGENLVYCDAPGAPHLLSASISGTEVVLSWQAATFAVSYNLYRVDTDDAPLLGSTSALEYRDAVTTAGNTQAYVVRAVFSDGFESEDSNLASLLVPLPVETPSATATPTPVPEATPTETPTADLTSTPSATPTLTPTQQSESPSGSSDGATD